MPEAVAVISNPWVLSVLVFIGCLITGPVFIPILRKLKFGQTIRDDGPSTHQIKAGTPTLGGIIFLIPAVFAFAFASIHSIEILPMALVMIGFGIIGLIDDLIKILKKSKDGLSASQKTVGLLLVATIYTTYLAMTDSSALHMLLPLTGLNGVIQLPVWLYIPFTIFVFYATTNAVNLTDGVDGLAASITFIVLLFFLLISTLISEDSTISIFSAVMAGGCLGFLVFNRYPARVFMGDCGALALGGAVSVLAVSLKIHWVILIAGFVYVVEALSVVIQVVSYKTRRVRVFRMTPIHHHYELGGWSEKKIVLAFSVVTVICCVCASLLVLAVL